MATSTERFGFTKPAGSDPASVVPLNSNTDLIEQYLGRTQDMIAPMYDDTATYNVGDIVTYESNLYKCITAISTAETFDPTKWEATTAVEEGSGGGGGSSVIPNPTGTPTDTLSTVSINGTIYDIEGSGGGGDGYKIEKIFDGNVTTAGNITLTKSIDNYDELIFVTNFKSIPSESYIRTFNVDVSIFKNIGNYTATRGVLLNDWSANTRYAQVRYVDNTTIDIEAIQVVSIVKIYGVKHSAGGGGGSSKAKDINYDNTTSQLTADNVQKAIDEVVANVGTASEDILTLQNVQGYDKYDETQTYAVGDYAIYNNIVYECTTAVSTAEPFDSTKWTATSIKHIIDGVKGDISQLNSSLNNKSNQLLVAVVTSGSKSVNANSTAYIDTTITKSGYTALGIVGLSGSGTGNFAFQDNSLVSSNTVARVYVRNLTNSTATINSLNIYILYVKN